MGLESFFLPARNQLNQIGQMDMPKNYDSRLTKAEAMSLPWTAFRDKLQPMVTVPITPDIEVSVVDKTILWAPSDVCVFVGGNRDVITIEDFSAEEGVAFLRFHYLLAQRVRQEGYIHRDQYQKMHMALGFNPEDFQLGAHSIRRLHTHIYTPFHWITDGRSSTVPLRKPVEWRKLDWFNRLKFYEPFSYLYYDFIQDQLNQGLLKDFLLRPRVENNPGYLSLALKNSVDFPDVFPQLQLLYKLMHEQYSLIESIFTNRSLDMQTDRFIPLSQAEREARFDKLMAKKPLWLSDRSLQLLLYLVRQLQPAGRRKIAGEIHSAREAWITKGFAGTLLFGFDQTSDEIRLDIFPRVITTSAPEKGIYGKNRPTIITRSSRPPTPYEKLEREKFYAFVIGTIKKYGDWKQNA